MYELNSRTSQLLNQSVKKTNCILQIEGYDHLLSVTDVYEILTFVSGVPILVGSTFGSKTLKQNVKKLISLEGTTNTVSQSVEPDKGQGTATSSITVKLVDVNWQMTKLISPSFVLDDILYKKTKFYVGFEEGIFPQDYNLVFSGVVTSIRSNPTTIDLTISHPEEIKRTEIFKTTESKVVNAIDYFSLVVGPLTLTRRGDFSGNVQFEIQNSGGPSGSISVSGGIITVFGVAGTTTYGRVKELLEGSVEAMQLVSVEATGDRNLTISAFPLTTLSSSSLITLSTVDGLFLPITDLLRTFVVIDDEIIEYETIDTVNKQLGSLTRASLGSFGKRHKADANVKSFYVLGNNTQSTNALELTKYILLSKGPEKYLEDVSISDIVSLPTGLSGPNALFFRNQFLNSVEGVIEGDTLEITDATNVLNDVTAEIEEIFEYDNGTYIKLVDSVSLVSESPTPAKAAFSSKYNVLPDGAGCTPDQVDLEQFKKVQNRFNTGISPYLFYLKETLKVKDFIEKECFFPTGLYSVPRKGKISCQYTAPAIFDGNFKPLDKDSVKNPKNIAIERSTGKFFYNAVVYKYEEDSVEDKFLRGSVTLSAESTARIKAPTKAININSLGLRDTPQTTALIERNTFRLLSRYKFGSESLDLSVSFEVGAPLEIGDAVQFGDESFMLPDTKTGMKRFAPRTFEIVNKELNWRTGDVRLKIVDTAFLGRRRYGLFSPSSRMDTGSTTNRLKLRQFYNPDPTRKEFLKWANYIGQQVQVRSTSLYSTATIEVVTIVGFDAVDEGSIYVAPALSFTPTQDSILEIPKYSGVGITEALVEGYKNRYVYWTPQVEVQSVVSLTELDVGADVTKFFVGSIVRVHRDDFSYDTGQTEFLVSLTSGSSIFLNSALPSGVASGDLIDLIGFISDNGDPYAWL